MDPQPPAVPPPPESRTRGGRRIWMIAAGVVLVLVVAAAAVALTSGGDDQASAATSPASVTPQAPAAAADVHAKPGSFTVKLTWSAGTDGAPAASYDIQRDTKIVGHTTETSWVDDDVIPEQKYTYQVIAVTADGQRLATAIDTHTQFAPAATAALDGTFNVRLHPTSHYGLSSFDEKDTTAGWTFSPTCKEGPCDTKLADLHLKRFAMMLDRTGGKYHGSASVSGFVRCGSQSTPSTFTLHITVTKADAVKDGWRVTAFTGELDQYEAAQLGCVSSGIHMTVSGKLVSAAGH
jgi:hypothetical protein